MKIFIDGDACPSKDIAYDLSAKYDVEVIIIMSIKHYSDANCGREVIYVDSDPQAADMAIVNRVSGGDIVITSDYGLASLCIMKRCICLSFTGNIIDINNIDELLSIRYINQKIREYGGRTKGPPKRNSRDDFRFKRNLEKIILQNLRPQLET
jgi:hypothetical protein